MNQELILVNPQDFGIEENQVNDLLGNLPQIKSERVILEEAYEDVILLDLDDLETSKKARELRLLIRDNRTKGIEKWHKVAKDYFLKGGQFVDAIKRKEIEVNQRMEEKLEEMEKYAENKEKERIEALKQSRLSQLEPFAEFVPFGIDLGVLSDEDFEKTLNGAKLQMEAKIKAEIEADKQRIEAEKKAEAERIAEQKRIEAQRLENERLKKEAEEKEKKLEERHNKLKPYINLIRDYNATLKLSDFDFEKELKTLNKASVADANFRFEQEAKLEKERKENEAKLEAERQAKAKLEAELKAKKEAEENAEAQRLAEIERQKKEAEKLAKAPIKKQLTQWVDSFDIPDFSQKNDLATEILKKFESFKTWSKAEINKL
jgi:hypothetical protein